MPVSWGVVVPVKLLHLAKTRLGAYGPAGRAELALAFAGDVVDAARACPSVHEVLVVTDDVRAARALAGPGVRVVPDLRDAGHNPALAHGALLLRAGDPEAGVAALSADLPAVRSDDLAAALACVGARAFVSDTSGAGTTLLAAAPGYPLDPSYGAGSAARHRVGCARAMPPIRRSPAHILIKLRA